MRWAEAVTEGRRVDLPGYPFQRRRYWLDANGTVEVVAQAIAEEAEETVADAESAVLRGRLAEADPAERPAILLDVVLDHACRVLGLEGFDRSESEAEFLALGFTSLTTLELRNALCGALGLEIPLTALLEHATPGALVTHLVERLAEDETPAPRPTERAHS